MQASKQASKRVSKQANKQAKYLTESSQLIVVVMPGTHVHTTLTKIYHSGKNVLTFPTENHPLIFKSFNIYILCQNHATKRVLFCDKFLILLHFILQQYDGDIYRKIIIGVGEGCEN